MCLVDASGVSTAPDRRPAHRFLVYDEHNPRQQDLWVLPLGPDDAPAGDPAPLVVTPADESHGQFSPDGRWLAYHSDDSGRTEVYVQEFLPGSPPSLASEREQLSTAGGNKPRWSPTGDELYYLSPDNQLMAVSVTASETVLEPGVPEALFDLPRVAPTFFSYDVGTDGRFLMAVTDVLADGQASAVAVLDWHGLLDR